MSVPPPPSSAPPLLPPPQELQLEDCANVWWLRFAMDYWCTALAVGTNTGRVLVFDPHLQQVGSGVGRGGGGGEKCVCVCVGSAHASADAQQRMSKFRKKSLYVFFAGTCTS